jgi:hypothetical protein
VLGAYNCHQASHGSKLSVEAEREQNRFVFPRLIDLDACEAAKVDSVPQVLIDTLSGSGTVA